MLKEIAAEAQTTAAYTGIAAFDARVMQAMAAVPRHEFVPEEERVSAYLDIPLPIGHGQTISQPYIVALMTDLLEIEAGDKVLEVGAGSGYQAAVLSKLARNVHTIEIVPELARACRERLARLGYGNVAVHEGRRRGGAGRRGAVRCDHRDGGGAARAAGAGGAAQAGRAHGDSAGRAGRDAGTGAAGEGCAGRGFGAAGAARALRAADGDMNPERNQVDVS